MKKILFFVGAALSLNAGAQMFSDPVAIDTIPGIGGNIGEYTSLCVVNGNPAIAYYDVTHENLMYMRATDPLGTTWNAPVVIDAPYNVGKFCCLKIVDGQPAISYLDQTHMQLKFVRATDSNGVNWGMRLTVFSQPNTFPVCASMEIVAGHPAIAFGESTSSTVRYMRATASDGSTWGSAQTILTAGLYGVETEFCIVNTRPAIAFADFQSGEIKFVQAQDTVGNSWNSPVVVSSSGQIGMEISVSHTSGKAVIAYYDQNATKLCIAIASNNSASSWSTPFYPDNAVNRGSRTSLVSNGGFLQLAYRDASTQETKFIHCLDTTGSVWSVPISIGTAGFGGYSLSLLVLNGNPAIAYSDGVNPMSMYFARANDGTGTLWPTPLRFTGSGATGRNVSMSIIDDRPAVASFNSVNSKLVYCIATDSTGQRWHQSRELLTATPSSICSIESVNNVPCIAYTSNGLNRLNYLRALDTAGNAWASPVRVDSIANAQNCKLIELNGLPAIAYFDNLTQQLKFTVAINTQGTLWMPHVLPVATVNQGWFDIAVVEGKPSIVFVDGSGLHYIHAIDSLGQTWTSPVLISSDATQPTPSLSIVNGNPAVVFQEGAPYTLHFCRALNSSGSQWGPLIETSPTAYGAFQTEMTIHDGRPVVVYSQTNADVYFIAANDINGNSWGTEQFVDSLYAFSMQRLGIVSTANEVGIAYYRSPDRSAYYTSTCLTPMSPLSAVTSVCAGNSVSLNAQGFGALAWYTAASGGSLIGSGSAFVTPALTVSTTYYVQDSTCAASSRTPVTVNVIPLPTLTLSGNTTICSGDSTQLTASGNGDGFFWSTGNTSASETFAPASTVNAYIATEGGGCNDTIHFTITVVQPITISQSPTICAGDNFTVGSNTYNTAGVYTDSLQNVNGCDSVIVTNLTVQAALDTTVTYNAGMLTSSENGASYQWINCTNSQAISGATTQNFTPTQNGTYAVIISSGVCTDTSACHIVTDVSVEETSGELQAIVVAEHGTIQATVTMGDNSVVRYSLFNAAGQLITEQTAASNQKVLMQVESAGMYLLLINVHDQQAVRRVIVPAGN